MEHIATFSIFENSQYDVKFIKEEPGLSRIMEFDVNGLKYRLTMKRIINYVDVVFEIVDENVSSFQTTNDGNVFKIMNTVFSEVEKYAKSLIPDHRIDGIRYDPTHGSNGSLGLSQNKRDQLYRRYILKHFPKTTFLEQGATVFAKINL